MKYNIPGASEMFCASNTSAVTIAEDRVSTIVANIKKIASTGKTWLVVNCRSKIERERLSEILTDFGYIVHASLEPFGEIALVIDWSSVSERSSGCLGLWAKFKKYFTG